MPQIFKPNIDVIRQQAQQAREAEQQRKEQDGLRFLDMVEGDNVFRLLPPTNSRGLLFKRVCNHYFRDTPFQGKIEKQRCIIQTHDDVEGATCPLCDIGDRILAQRPDMKIDRWHRPGIGYFGQAISRSEPEGQVPLARIARVTPGVKNWITQQFEQAWGQGIDITDFNQGLDINVVKGEKQTKKGKRTEYKPAIASLMGPTPVVANLPEGWSLEQAINTIVESMYDLDQIWSFPDDEALAKINKAASDIYSYYMKQGYQHPGATVQVPGTYSQPQPQQPQQPQAVTPQSQPAQPQPQPVQPQQPVQPVQQPPQPTQPQQQQPANPQQVAQAATAVAQGQPQPPQQVPQPAQQQLPQTQAPAAPTDRPSCWGGAAPRPDGGVGYYDESEHCLMCPHELTCMDACKQAGITGAA